MTGKSHPLRAKDSDTSGSHIGERFANGLFLHSQIRELADKVDELLLLRWKVPMLLGSKHRGNMILDEVLHLLRPFVKYGPAVSILANELRAPLSEVIEIVGDKGAGFLPR